ncbi:MAG: copper amine oxidase N-terminal domain-containing protein [Clostridia bacterium]|nr:copper amine oxidase N-terminal domain-containing protein [Clostridia bacterium]
MEFKKLLAGFLSATVLSLTTVTAFADNIEDIRTISSKEVMPVNGITSIVKQSYFNSFTGTVKKITDFDGVKGSKFVLVENEKGGEANIIVSKDTYIVNDAEIAVGSVITGFYDANAPILMIYPPQYNAEVVCVEMKDKNVKVDVFNKDLVSADQTLKLNISDETEIILQDGKAFNGKLADKKLVVIYGVSTKSIPAQTAPEKIVVLFEKDVSKMNIVVNKKKIEAPAAYMDEKGTVMVPLRAVAKALGVDVSWNGKQQSMMLGKGISLTIGKDYYTYMKTAPIQLGTAPALIKGKTFVPLSFFKDVMRMESAQVVESQIAIDSGEISK